MHFIATEGKPAWSFNGDVAKPTFGPSVKITGKLTVKDSQGKWTGEWVRDAAGMPVDACCHYLIKDGRLEFCADSTHALAGKTVALPELPSFMTD